MAYIFGMYYHLMVLYEFYTNAPPPKLYIGHRGPEIYIDFYKILFLRSSVKLYCLWHSGFGMNDYLMVLYETVQIVHPGTIRPCHKVPKFFIET